MNETDELLKLLEQAEKDARKPYRKMGEVKQQPSTRRFIKEFNLQSGLERVPNYVIFYTYKIRWKVGQEKKTNKINFFRTFNNFFQQVRTGKQRYYLMDKAGFDLSREGLLEAKHYDEKYKKTIKTLNKKKKGKVSKSKEKPEPKGS